MAAVYDPEKPKTKKLTDDENTPEYLRERENAPDNPDEKDNQPAGDPTDPTTHSAKESTAGLAQSDGEASFYKKSSPKKSFTSRISGSKNLKGYLVFGGIIASIIAVFISLFSFLNIFKLNDLMSAVDQRAFVRNNAALNGRSSKYISAYIEVRMMDVGDPNNPDLSNPDPNKRDNLLFRSQKVDTNSPFTDWYKTMRASNFEKDLLQNEGIKFTSMVTAEGKIRPGVIDIYGTKTTIPEGALSDKDLVDISTGKTAALNKYKQYFETTEFSSNKIARSKIKDAVNRNTRFYQVYKRRQIRKAIQNMTGVRDWKFFETSRDKISAKKIDLRNRMLDKILPDPNNNVVSKVVRCLYGLDKCTPNRDVAASQNKVSGISADEGTNTDAGSPNENTPTETAPFDAAAISDTLKKILVAANVYSRIVNIPQTLNMLQYINENISKLVKLVVIARGAQAAGLFQVFETANDQMKSGQVDANEVNALMQNLDTASSSAAFAEVIDAHVDPTSEPQTGGACDQKNQALQEKDPEKFKEKFGSYAPLCANQQIGSAANAQKIQDAYNATLRPIVNPIATAWGKVKGTPGIGQIISALTWLGNIANSFTDTVLNGVLSAIGLDGDVKAAISWVFTKTSDFLGVSIIKGYESGGTIFNWVMQGAAYTAESTARLGGAALTTPATKLVASNQVALYQSDTQQQTSTISRIASLNNPDSFSSKTMLGLSNLRDNPSNTVASGIGSLWSGTTKNLASVFGRGAAASNVNGYTASQFAGIETYDYPQKCYDLDPLNEQPLDGTNALTIFAQNNIPVAQKDQDSLNNWVTETDSDTFYNKIYDIIGTNANADDIAVQIYNCNLLDASVRGSMGFLYGYTDNNGLNQ